MLIPAPRDDLCLAFANTLSWRGSATPSEGLGGTEDLLRWLGSAAKLPGASIAAAADRLRRRPNEAASLFEGAIGLREAIYRICIAVVKGWRAAAGDLELLNRELAAARARERVVAGGKRFAWEWDRRIPDLDRMLWPVARSAAELLTSPDLVFTRACQGEDCGWLFLDTSRNRTRRWCDMSDCGNLAKVRRFRRRRGRAR